MYKFIAIVTCAFILACCAPQAHFFEVEVYDNEKVWELDLKGRNAAVFSMAPNIVLDSIMMSEAGIGMAERLESDRQMEAGSIEVYSIPIRDFSGFDSSVDFDKSFLNNLMLSTNADMQLFIEDFKFGAITAIARDNSLPGFEQVLYLPYNLKFTIYDALAGEVKLHQKIADTVYFRSSIKSAERDLRAAVAPKLPNISKKIGETIAQQLSKQWREQERTIITYYGSKAWTKPYELAMDYKWKEAIKLWMPLTNSENPKKAAYAAYNIAVACEMLDEFALAKEWINFSLKKYKFQYALTLKSKLEERIYQQ